MKHLKLWKRLFLALAAVGVAGCSVDSITAPPKVTADASAGLVGDLLGGLFKKDVLERKKPLSKDITVSKTIGKSGGTISIPEAGFTLTVPANAVKTNTNFTVTAIKGSLVAYEFGPHGIKFDKSLTFKQDLNNTEWSLLKLKLLTGGYFKNRSDLDHKNAVALVSEVLNGLLIPLTKEFSFKIDHFSGYIVAW
jgi:hypothetical protein